MAALAEGGEIGIGVVGGVVVAMGRGQNHPGPAHGPEDVHSTGLDAHPPPAPVAPGGRVRIPPSPVAEVDYRPPVRSPAALAASLSAPEPDYGRELGPVDRVEEAVLGPDRHGDRDTGSKRDRRARRVVRTGVWAGMAFGRWGPDGLEAEEALPVSRGEGGVR